MTAAQAHPTSGKSVFLRAHYWKAIPTLHTRLIDPTSKILFAQSIQPLSRDESHGFLLTEQKNAIETATIYFVRKNGEPKTAISRKCREVSDSWKK